MKASPVVFRWLDVEVTNAEDGTVERVKAMVPVLRYRNLAARQYGSEDEAAEHMLIPMHARSSASHSQYFAALKDGFDNLPEKVAARWPTATHLRKWLLIETGWFTEKEFVFEGRGAELQAKRLALFCRTEDEFARVSIHRVIAGEDNREAALDKGVEAFGADDAIPLRERLRLAIRAVLSSLDKGGTYKVIVKKAMSQDHASMGKEAFQASKSEVLDLLEQFVGVKRGELMKNAGKAS